MERNELIRLSYERYRQTINERNIVSRRVSQDTGISNPVFTAWKNGERMPKESSIRAIAEYLNINADFLLGTSDKPSVMKENADDYIFVKTFLTMLKAELPQFHEEAFEDNRNELPYYSHIYSFMKDGKEYCFDDDDVTRLYMMLKKTAIDTVMLMKRSKQTEREILHERAIELQDYLRQDVHTLEDMYFPACRLFKEGEKNDG